MFVFGISMGKEVIFDAILEFLIPDLGHPHVEFRILLQLYISLLQVVNYLFLLRHFTLQVKILVKDENQIASEQLNIR